MCEFISWIEVQRGETKNVFYLDDELLFSERSKEILEGSKDNDFLGHHAIRHVWNLQEREGREGENRDFWNTDQLPSDLQLKLKDFLTFKKHFGKMFSEYVQLDDLRYIIENVPEDKRWKGLKEFCEGQLADRIQERVNQLLKTVKLEKLKITARYSKTINELRKAAKFDGYINSDVTNQHFSEEKRPDEEREAILVHIGQVASTEEIEVVIKHLKLHSGNVKALLSLSIDHPDKQRKFPIVEFSSVWRDPYGNRNVACLNGWDGKRSLSLFWREVGWGGGCRFLAFREV